MSPTPHIFSYWKRRHPHTHTQRRLFFPSGNSAVSVQSWNNTVRRVSASRKVGDLVVNWMKVGGVLTRIRHCITSSFGTRCTKHKIYMPQSSNSDWTGPTGPLTNKTEHETGFVLTSKLPEA
ncbi:hypothetical protein CBL_06565 [Carabus blaptoides fortunei]